MNFLDSMLPTTETTTIWIEFRNNFVFGLNFKKTRDALDLWQCFAPKPKLRLRVNFDSEGGHLSEFPDTEERTIHLKCTIKRSALRYKVINLFTR